METLFESSKIFLTQAKSREDIEAGYRNLEVLFTRKIRHENTEKQLENERLAQKLKAVELALTSTTECAQNQTKTLSELEQEVKSTSSQIEALQTKDQQLKTENNSLKTKFQQLAELNEKLEIQVHSKDGNIEMLQKKLSNLEQKSVEIDHALRLAKGSLNVETELHVQDLDKIKELNNTIENLTLDKTVVNNSIEDFKQEKNTLIEEINSAKSEITKLKEQLAKKPEGSSAAALLARKFQTERNELKNKIDELQKAIEELKAENEILTTKNNEDPEELTSEELLKNLQDLSRELAEIDEEVQKDDENLIAQIDQLTIEKNKLQNTLDELTKKLNLQ